MLVSAEAVSKFTANGLLPIAVCEQLTILFPPLFGPTWVNCGYLRFATTPILHQRPWGKARRQAHISLITHDLARKYSRSATVNSGGLGRKLCHAQPAPRMRPKSWTIAREHPAARGRTMHGGSNAGDGAADSTPFSLILISVREDATFHVAKCSLLQSFSGKSRVLTVIGRAGREIDAKCWGMCMMRRGSSREIDQLRWGPFEWNWERFRVEESTAPERIIGEAGGARPRRMLHVDVCLNVWDDVDPKHEAGREDRVSRPICVRRNSNEHPNCLGSRGGAAVGSRAHDAFAGLGGSDGQDLRGRKPLSRGS